MIQQEILTFHEQIFEPRKQYPLCGKYLRMTEYISIHTFARMFRVTVRTVRNWMKDEDVFIGQTIRRNKTLFLAKGAVDEWVEKHRRVDK